MSNVAKLKKKAAEFELKKQFDKALATYIEILDSAPAGDDEIDVSLYNRVGDLLYRQGNVADAVDYYERAVDKYADGGFFNNAIALCNKILRQSPGRTSVYYKLGKISAQKGFTRDAKQNFLEYASRMQQANRIDEAFRALKEFADLCPDQDDIRLMLAEQLSKQSRSEEAIEQLQLLYDRYVEEGREDAARDAQERIRSLDPDAGPRRTTPAAPQQRDDLIFLSLDDEPAPARSPSASRAAPQSEPRVELELDVVEQPSPDLRPDVGGGTLLEGLESSTFGGDAPPAATGGMLDGLEPTTFGEVPAGAPDAPPSGEGPEEESDVGDVDLPFLVPPDDRADDDETTDGGAPLTFLSVDDDVLEVPGEHSRPTPRPARTPAANDGELLDFGELDLSMPASAATPMPAREVPVAGADGIPLMDLGDDPLPDKRTRRSTLAAARSVELLHAMVEGDPDDHATRRQLADALIESGDRERGLVELEAALAGFESTGDVTSAASIADDLARLDPDVRHHQKRVELAFRLNDRGRLLDGYLALADALEQAREHERSRGIYQRVLELAPDDVRAQAALAAAPEVRQDLIPQFRTSPPLGTARMSGAAKAPREPEPAPAADDFVNLGDWLREDDEPKSTRMVVDEQEPTGDEDADFADMLRKFKQGVADNVEDTDYDSHYDLGVAYKEMGLLDEAIAEFQRALRGPAHRVRTYEALGQCFVEKGQLPIAAAVLQRALAEPGTSGDEQLVGVLYLLGLCAEGQGKKREALEYFQRVLVVDIQFRDVAERMTQVERMPS